MVCKFKRNGLKCGVSGDFLSIEQYKFFCEDNFLKCNLYSHGIAKSDLDKKFEKESKLKNEIKNLENKLYDDVKTEKSKAEYFRREFLFTEGKHNLNNSMYETLGDITVALEKQIEAYDEYIFEVLLYLESNIKYLRSNLSEEKTDEKALKDNLYKCEGLYRMINQQKDKVDSNVSIKKERLVKEGNNHKTAYDKVDKGHKVFRNNNRKMYGELVQNDPFRKDDIYNKKK